MTERQTERKVDDPRGRLRNMKEMQRKRERPNLQNCWGTIGLL